MYLGENFSSWLNSAEVLQQLTTSRFFLIFFVVLISAVKHSSYKSMFVTWIINLLGTVLHEAAHFTVGFILNARPVGFTLFPKKVGDAFVMGSVGFNNMTFYNAVPAALAPLLLLVAAFYLDRIFFNLVPLSIGTYLLFLFIMGILIENSLPSPADFRAAVSSPAGVLLYVLLVSAGLLYLSF